MEVGGAEGTGVLLCRITELSKHFVYNKKREKIETRQREKERNSTRQTEEETDGVEENMRQRGTNAIKRGGECDRDCWRM